MEILKKINILLDRKQKTKMVLMVFLMLIGGALETFSIALVIPVLQTVMEPSSMQGTGVVAKIYGLFCTTFNIADGTEAIRSFTVFLLIALIVMFVLKNLFLLFQNIVQYRFVFTNQFETSKRVMVSYMKRPYEYYLQADTSVIQRSITSDVNNMFGLVLGVLQLLSEVIIFIFLSIALLIFDAMMTLVVTSILLLTIIIIKQILKPIMERAGKENQHYYSGLFKWIQQAVTGIKEIKIMNRERYFIDEYVKCGEGYVEAVQKYNIYNNTPRLLIETVCVAGMILYMLVLIIEGGDIKNMVPLLGAFSMAAMRLMPCANRINNYLTSISYFKPFIMGVSENLRHEIDGGGKSAAAFDGSSERLIIKNEISLSGITYAYPNTDKLIFDDANMSIPIGKSVGIVGASGAGKTTVVDVLLGLLELKSGTVLADGHDVLQPSVYAKWLKNIGYIPQTIFMLDDTIRKNVAFGIAEDEIDEERLWEVLREAQMSEFIKSLPEGLETGIGERGIRLSGGQRQRIGIARALYHNPEVLVLDEATSALDNDTESAIMDSVNILHGKKTLIIIAHRLQTIKQCDIVYRAEGGKLILSEKHTEQ